MVPPPPSGEPDDLDEVLDLDSDSRSPARSRRSRGRPTHGGRPPGVRRWESGSDDDALDDLLDEGSDKRRRVKPPVYWRARDSLYFEPLVALAIIVILLVSLYAYTSNWPPVYVVESNSMQHGPGDHVGDINAGDIVLAQKVPFDSIVTYVDALTTGFSTYGLLGDVILYNPNGTSSATPIIHRAIIYLEYDPHNATYNATGLTGDSCGNSGLEVYYAPGTTGGCGTSGLTGGDSLILYNVGGRTVTVEFNCPLLGSHSGFLTLGDNNSYPDQNTVACSVALSSLVEPGWVIGVARGMLPWFGALKLLFEGNAGKVPAASWEYLGLTIAGIVFLGAGLHLFLRRRRGRPVHDARDKEADEEDTGPPANRPRRAASPVRPWRGRSTGREEDAPAERPASRVSHEQKRRSHFTTSREYSSARRRSKEPPQDDNPNGSNDDR